MDPMGNAMYFSGSGTTILLDPHVAFSTRRGAVYRVGRPGIVDQWIPPVLYPGVIICGWNGESWSIRNFQGPNPLQFLIKVFFKAGCISILKIPASQAGRKHYGRGCWFNCGRSL